MKHDMPNATTASVAMSAKPRDLLRRAAMAFKALFTEAEAEISSNGTTRPPKPQEGVFQPPKF